MINDEGIVCQHCVCVGMLYSIVALASVACT